MWLSKQIHFVEVVVIVVISLGFKHVKLQVFLKTDLERPRPHTDEDWGHMDVHARPRPCGLGGH